MIRRIGAPDERRLAERAVDAWRAKAHSERIDIPLGTVAALTLVEVADPDGPDLPTQWAELSDTDLVEMLRAIWQVTWLRQPYLIEVARPLHEWLDEELTPDLLAGIRAVITAAFRYQILDITGSSDPAMRSDVDLLGAILTELRAPGDRKHRGEYHTPTAVSDLMASMTIDELLPPGSIINEPAAGSGGLIRAAAQHIRALGGDPRDYVWSMADIDRYATAACAVNAMIWGLGDNVVIFCGDTLAHDDGHDQAVDMRRRVLAHHASELQHARFRIAANHIDQLLEPSRAA